MTLVRSHFLNIWAGSWFS